MRTSAAVAAALLVALMALGSVWQPHDPDAIDLARRFGEASVSNPLGTDHLGRDMLSRLMVGGWRTALVLLIVGAIGFVGGTTAGVAAAVLGGWRETVILRLAELPILLPTLIVALTAGALFGLGPVTAGIALGLAGLGPYALLSHSLARRVMGQPYFLSARALGLSAAALTARHVVPNIAPILLTHLGASAGFVIINYSALAFLGLGADTSKPDWGAMLFEYRVFLFDQPRLMMVPGLAIAAVATLLNIAFDRDQFRSSAG